jgi:hypothetical protein
VPGLRVVVAVGGRLSREFVDEMDDVMCHHCGFEGAGMAFPTGADGRVCCPRCGRVDLRPGERRKR